MTDLTDPSPWTGSSATRTTSSSVTSSRRPRSRPLPSTTCAGGRAVRRGRHRTAGRACRPGGSPTRTRRNEDTPHRTRTGPLSRRPRRHRDSGRRRRTGPERCPLDDGRDSRNGRSAGVSRWRQLTDVPERRAAVGPRNGRRSQLRRPPRLPRRSGRADERDAVPTAPRCRPRRTGRCRARHFETSTAYHDYLAEQGGTVLPPESVAGDPAGAVDDALAALGDVDAVYVSLDLDVLSAAAAPGVSAPTPGGLSTRDLFRMLGRVAADDRVAGFEVVECAPPLDAGNRTARAGARAVAHFLSGLGGDR